MHDTARVALLADVRGRRCVVVGGGAGGAAKAARLADAGARVTVIDPRPAEAVAADPRLSLERRAFRDDDVVGTWLAVAATGDDEVNSRVARAAEAAGVWVNRADRSDGGPACLVALLDRGPVQVAIATGGASPALGVWLRDRVAAALPPAVGRLAELLAERGRGPSGRRGHRGLPLGGALDRLVAGDEKGARDLLASGPAPAAAQAAETTPAAETKPVDEEESRS